LPYNVDINVFVHQLCAQAVLKMDIAELSKAFEGR